MPPLPKRKISKTRGKKRRSHWKIQASQLELCPKCDAPVQPYHVCPSCGTYRGKQVIEIKEG